MITKKELFLFSQKIDLAIANKKKNLDKVILENGLDLFYDPIVVRNRTQEEIKENLLSKEVRKREKELFENNEELKRLPEKCKGIQSLIDLLLQIQKDNLLGSKDKIKDKISQEYEKVTKELSNMPKKWDNLGDLRAILYECCNKFDDILDRKCKGDFSGEETPGLNEEISVPSQIREKMEDLKKHFNMITQKIFEESYIKKVAKRVKNSTGLGLENFFDHQCFYSILKEEMKNLFSKCEEFIIKISKLMKEILNKPIEQAFCNYKNLMERIKKYLFEVLDERVGSCVSFFNEIKKLECNMAFTLNDNYNKVNKDFSEKVESNFQKYNDYYADRISNFKINIENLDISEGAMKNYILIRKNQDLKGDTIKVINSLYVYFTVFKNRFTDFFFMKISNELYYNIGN